MNMNKPIFCSIHIKMTFGLFKPICRFCAELLSLSVGFINTITAMLPQCC